MPKMTLWLAYNSINSRDTKIDKRKHSERNPETENANSEALMQEEYDRFIKSYAEEIYPKAYNKFLTTPQLQKDYYTIQYFRKRHKGEPKVF